MKFLIPFLCSLSLAAQAGAKTEKTRLIWNRSPETSITVGWCQVGGTGAEVHYRKAGEPGEFTTHGIDRETTFLGLESRFARLEGLTPDTSYEFVLVDSDSTSEVFRFKTAPAGEASFSFVAGGDSRNHRDARQRANRTVEKLRPLFVCFGGDMIVKPTHDEWADWLDDWQLTTGEDGHMIPIIAARGNHEGPDDIHAIFDTPNADDYYAVGFGAGFLRVYTLNSNIVRAGSQGSWLESDLAENAGAKWKIAQYHHPFRPHQSGKREQHAQYNAWAAPFFKYGLDLAVECDSHVVKRTWPLRPSNGPGSEQGFIRDDAFGTVFIGEGCWGAPLRPADDNKSWTRDSGSFNQVDWICVTPDWLTVRTVKVDNVENAEAVDPGSPFELPAGMELWKPENGEVVKLLPREWDNRPPLDPATLARLEIIADQREFTGSTTIRLVVAEEEEDLGELEIRYTLDKSEPTSGSALYTDAFDISETTEIRAAIFREGERLSTTERATVTRVTEN